MESHLKALHSSPSTYTPTQATEAFALMTKYALNLPSPITPAQIGAYLVLFNKISSRPEILSAVATVFKGKAVGLEIDPPTDAKPVVDIVGTGGDGKNTFNVSSAAAMVCE